MVLNFGVLKTPAGFLKLLHTVLAAVAFGIVIYYTTSNKYVVVIFNEMFFFVIVTFAFMLTSFLLLVTYLIDESADSIRKSLFELMYHALGFILYFTASISYVVRLSKSIKEARDNSPDIFAAAVFPGVCGLVNSLAYLFNAIIVHKSRRS